MKCISLTNPVETCHSYQRAIILILACALKLCSSAVSSVSQVDRGFLQLANAGVMSGVGLVVRSERTRSRPERRKRAAPAASCASSVATRPAEDTMAPCPARAARASSSDPLGNRSVTASFPCS
ncbi:hypothetical protein ANCDUO_03553 [Ancylostoma duodenale]|uniref:Uncharacterized protein n=1 Tax=Ancylostoma duodenale TaxID=51022 RepID=A0A0C2DTH6_9BILA|nr:hypothetical protein ANCDUO_03553 [Ancylostoma duodenale]